MSKLLKFSMLIDRNKTDTRRISETVIRAKTVIRSTGTV